MRRLADVGLALLLAGGLAAELLRHGTGGGQALFFGLAPDLALLYGMGKGLDKGQLHPRAVGLYNAVHHFLGPLLLAVAAGLGWLGPDGAWLVGALAWATHIAVDHAVGYGERTPQGFLSD
jgi:hypothetical protein